MVAVAKIFRDVLDDRREPAQGMRLLRAIEPSAAYSNGFVHGANGALYVMG